MVVSKNNQESINNNIQWGIILRQCSQISTVPCLKFNYVKMCW